MRPQASDRGRERAVAANGREPDNGAPDRNSPDEKRARRGVLLSQEPETRAGSKVTWQGFVAFMTARGAHPADA
jgi:hypothetical protein